MTQFLRFLMRTILHRQGKLFRVFPAILLMLTASVLLSSNASAVFGGVTIQGSVRLDVNRNGVVDIVDTPSANITILLLDGNNQTVGSTTTDSAGAFSFSDWAPGTYRLRILACAYCDIKAFPGNNALRLDDTTIYVNATGLWGVYYSNVFLLCEDVGRICGRVVNDLNCDGGIDSTDPGVPGVLLTLRNASNVAIDTRTSNSGGYYCFTDLTPGVYTVVETLPAGFAASNAIAGPGGTEVNSTTIRVDATTPGAEYYANFLLCGSVEIGAQVYIDTNRNGALDVGEPPRSGVTVQLLDSNSGGVASAVTSSSGAVEFQVVPGNYRLREIVPNGYNASNAFAGPGGTRIDSTTIAIAATTAGQSYCPNMFLLCAFVNIGAQVYVDSNRNGLLDTGEPPLAGVTVQLVNSSSVVVNSAVTNSSGAVSFRMPPGNYQLRELVPNGYNASNSIAGPSATRVDSTNIAVAATTPGVHYTTNKFLLCAFVNIGAQVYVDSNRNGLLDTGEPPLAGVTVQLVNSSSVVVNSAVTNSSGAVSFRMPPGNYRLHEIVPAGYNASNAIPGPSATRVDSSNISVAATTPGVSYTPNKFLLCLLPVKISGRVVSDLNGNGAMDSTEPGIGGVLLTLSDAANVVVATKTTNSEGYYSFTDLVPGTYTVVETVPAGYVASNAVPGAGGVKVDLTTIRISATTAGLEYYANFLLCAFVDVGAQVYVDINRNGAYDMGEPPLAGVTVQLLNSSSVVVASAVTNSSGAVEFHVPPGNYRLHEIVPNGYHATNAIPGPNATRIDNTNISVAATTPGVRYTTNKFLLCAYVDIEAQVYVDSNRNGLLDTGEPPLAGVTVQLLNSSSVVVNSAVTNSNGEVSFRVPPGSYRLKEIVPAGYNASNAIPGPSATRVDSSNISVAATTPGVSYTPNKFLLCLQPVRISGRVVSDINCDGAVDSSEPGIPGVLLTLRNADNLVVATQTSNSDGSYSFTDLPPGTYTLEVTVPAGYAASNIIAGPGGTKVDATTVRISATTAGAEYYANFLLCGHVDICAQVYVDTNRNGLLDAGEPPRPGVTIQLLDGRSVVVASAITNSSGVAEFQVLAGTYRLKEVVPNGYNASNAIPGPEATRIDRNNISVAATTPGQSYCPNKFLLCAYVDIGAQVYIDTNRNGALDTGEPPLGGVTVQLLNSSLAVVASAATNSSGAVSFRVPPGSYRLKESVPAGYDASNAIAGPSATRIDSTNISVAATTPGVSYTPNKFLLKAVPCIALRKSANVSQVLPGGRVIYTYTVTNTGTAGLVNVKVVDNNGTPDYDGDDFTVGTIASLDPGQNMNLTATVIPPVKLCAKDTGVAVGTLVTNILPDGSIKVTFNQAAGVNDNTYGVNSEGWGSRIHRFSDLVNSDQATFSFTDTGGRVVLAFKLDYITKASSATFPSGQVLYPSGYGTLGVNGGDGGMKTGNRAYVLYATTSLTQNLNQSPEYYGVIVDSPASGSTLASKWDKVMRYTVIVDKAAFGTAGFGKVTIIDQHNSPQKCPDFIPIICDNCVTNTAVVTGEDSAGTAVRASATATVLVTSNAP